MHAYIYIYIYIHRRIHLGIHTYIYITTHSLTHIYILTHSLFLSFSVSHKHTHSRIKFIDTYTQITDGYIHTQAHIARIVKTSKQITHANVYKCSSSPTQHTTQHIYEHTPQICTSIHAYLYPHLYPHLYLSLYLYLCLYLCLYPTLHNTCLTHPNSSCIYVASGADLLFPHGLLELVFFYASSFSTICGCVMRHSDAYDAT